LSRFVRHWPRLSVEVAEGGTDAHFELLRSGRYDFVLGPVSNEEREPDFFQEELFTDQVGIFIRPGNPLCQRQNLSLHDLIQCDWILPPVGAQLRPRLENLFRNEGLELPPFAIETGTLHIVKRLLVTTDMVGAIARMIIKPELRRGELVELKGSWNFIHRPFGVYWRKGYPLSAAARELILNIKAAIRELDLRPETKN
jgi:LysR family transcriptional regulator of gallate degradation